MVAVCEELARPRVLATLEDLAARKASGVFEVAGNPSGAIYLDEGRIAFARASWVPGLAVRLGARCPGLAVPSGQDADDMSVADLAVRNGYLDTAGLEEIIRSIVVDAFLVLTVPLAADSPVASISFASTRTYWTGAFPRLGLDFVRGEAFRRAKLMARYDLSPATRVALCDLAVPAVVLTREQWAVTSRIGDQASARELALRCGGALSDTVQCLGTLIRAGVCAPVGASGPARSQAPGGTRPGGPSSELALPVRPPARDLPARPAGPGQPPAPDILRQVLNGLRKLR